ncbi:MAG: histone deacetylase [Candidatus Hydrogenedentes bacterium]|nr:histone deacetylase [Candidatus Hydrogenedentota bacterium]
MARTGFLYLNQGLAHDAGPHHPESPERLEAIARAFERARLNPPLISPQPATHQDLARVHSEEHIALIEQTCKTGAVYPDPDTGMGAGSWDAALHAAGGVIAACRAVLKGEFDNAFCAVRPPGHHAERERAMGFCLFNNVAMAARWLQREAGVDKVAILDWDVHHGNGTQQAFYEDAQVYVAGIHQHPLYPGTGDPAERGAGQSNLNIRMPWGAGPREWLAAIESRILPELTRFAPDFLLISCGFDAHRLDPLAAQELESDTFAQMTRSVRAVAGGRIVSVLEGGYHLAALGESAALHFQALQE